MIAKYCTWGLIEQLLYIINKCFSSIVKVPNMLSQSLWKLKIFWGANTPDSYSQLLMPWPPLIKFHSQSWPPHSLTCPCLRGTNSQIFLGTSPSPQTPFIYPYNSLTPKRPAMSVMHMGPTFFICPRAHKFSRQPCPS